MNFVCALFCRVLLHGPSHISIDIIKTEIYTSLKWMPTYFNCVQYLNQTQGHQEELSNPQLSVPLPRHDFTLQWRHNDHDGVKNHQPHGCLFNRLFRHRSKKTSKLCVTGLCAGNSPGPVNSPHKWPVTRKMFPFEDVIMPAEFMAAIYDEEDSVVRLYFIQLFVDIYQSMEFITMNWNVFIN